MKHIKKELRFLAIVVLGILAAVVDSTLYLISFFADAIFAAGIIWLAWGFMKEGD